MGEPLNNYKAVTAAVSLMTDPRAFALRRASVTVRSPASQPVASVALHLQLCLHVPLLAC